MLQRRRLLRGMLGASLSVSVLARAAVRPQGAAPQSLRLWPAEEYTRFVLSSDRQLKAVAWPLKGDRLVVDIEGVTLTESLRREFAKPLARVPYARSVSIRKLADGRHRMTVVLSGKVKPDVFIVRPTARKNHRLVIDLYPANPKDVIAEVLSGDEDDIIRHLTGMKDTGPAAGKAAARPQRARPAAKPARKPAKPGTKQLVVAIDPGHGGEDPGALGARGTQEKTVVLRIARELHRLIGERDDMRSFLTRRGDYFVPLAKRADIAVRGGANLFISIHADAFSNPEACGSSVFILSEKGASSSGARWLADENNAADAEGGMNLGHVRDAAARQALAGMIGDAQIRDSIKVGRQVLGSIALVNRPHSGRVERAGFRVLKSPVPSLLVETAFLSNPLEEKRLRSPEFRTLMAEAILDGIIAGWKAAPDLTA